MKTRQSSRVAAITIQELGCLEDIIRGGIQSFMSVGLALIEIRVTKAYRLRHFETFEAYCQETFGFTARHGRRMMVAARTAESVAAVTGDRLPNENVARALAPIASDADALRKVKARLEARGQSMGTASGNVLTALLPRPKRLREFAHGQPLAKLRRTVPSNQTGSDNCPHCKTRPHRYFYRESEGGWMCSHCNGIVQISVLG